MCSQPHRMTAGAKIVLQACGSFAQVLHRLAVCQEGFPQLVADAPL